MLISAFDFAVTFLDLYGIWFLFAVIAFIMCLVFFSRRKNDRIPKSVFIKLLSGLGLFFLTYIFISHINPNYLGFGYSTEYFEEPIHKDSVFWGVNEWALSASGGKSPRVHRIQGVNLTTGAKLFRRLIRHNKMEILTCEKQTVWILANKEISGIGLLSGQTEQVLNKETLQKNFPDFSAGVYRYDYNTNTGLLDVTTKDGFITGLDLSTQSLVAKPQSKDNDPPYKVEKDRISKKIDSIPSGYHTLISFNDENTQLQDGNKNLLNKSVVFKKGQFLLFDSISNTCITLSYDEAKPGEFILRKLTLSGKLLWQAEQADLGVGDFFEREPKFTTAFPFKNNIIFSFRGFIFSLNSISGKSNWLTRL